jgi:hypothetical protein
VTYAASRFGKSLWKTGRQFQSFDNCDGNTTFAGESGIAQVPGGGIVALI